MTNPVDKPAPFELIYIYPAEAQVPETREKIESAIEKLARHNVVCLYLGGMALQCRRGWLTEERRIWFAARHDAIVAVIR